MELNQLRYVVAVADGGNFTRAATRCNVSQPSLSQQIIQLEKEIGHKLFHRLGRKAVPTEAGAAFLGRARRILQEVDDASKELSDNPALERKIMVGAVPTLAPYLLPHLIGLCQSRFPNLQVDVREDFKNALVEAVIEGDLDLAIIPAPVKDPRIHSETLLQEPLLLVVAKDHPLASRPRVTVADLADQTFALLGSSSTLAAQVRAFCGDNHFEPRIAYRCAQVATVKALVACGVGISILPRMAQSPEDRDALSYITLADGSPTRELIVIRHLQRYQTRGAGQFLGLLRECTDEPLG